MEATTRNCSIPSGTAPYHLELQATAWNCPIPSRTAPYRLELLHTGWICKLPPGKATIPARIGKFRLVLRHDRSELRATIQNCDNTAWNWKIPSGIVTRPPGIATRPYFFHFRQVCTDSGDGLQRCPVVCAVLLGPSPCSRSSARSGFLVFCQLFRCIQMFDLIFWFDHSSYNMLSNCTRLPSIRLHRSMPPPRPILCSFDLRCSLGNACPRVSIRSAWSAKTGILSSPPIEWSLSPAGNRLFRIAMVKQNYHFNGTDL
ncbi:hypothetical protein NC99_18660 [Sunxiuqinia dokdonensis]|uniref:Uncharacterized protein n=1 Tax=Sunxiuqinia dokdonensis TaxID=1409788 RepID=A0A0L8VAG8_9BACT|nr:hypothetical protein NC99_18660 [Sunxiuqinia dokdonensis]